MAERKIFVLVDNSEAANNALQWYLTEVSREKDELFLVHCAENDYGITLPGPAVNVESVLQQATKNKDNIDIMMNGYMEQIRPKAYIRAKCKVLSGKPGEEIIKEVEKEHPQILVMGSRGLGKIRRTVLGSVSEYIIHHAPSFCSVTIIRNS